MQAIRTTFKGPDNNRGATMRANCATAHLSMSYDHKLDEFGNHRAAFCALRDRLGWTVEEGYPEAFAGSFAGDYYWVFAETHAKGACNQES